MAGITAPNVTGDGSTGGGGLFAASTIGLILAKNPNNYWRGSQLGTSVTLGDHGQTPLGLPEVGTPTYAASTPMALEPLTTDILLDGATDAFRNATNQSFAYTSGIMFIFFRPAATALSTLMSQHSTGGTTELSLVMNSSTVFNVGVVRDGAGVNLSQSVLTLGSPIATNTYHMMAVRQPADGNGMNWFLDGQFFAASAPQVTENLVGAGTLDWWFNDTQGAVDPPNQFGIGKRPPTAAQFFNGRFFAAVVDSQSWSDAEISAVWNQAVANGL